MAITTLNLRALNRSDTASAGQLVTATSAVAMDFQAAAAGGKIGQVVSTLKTDTESSTSTSFVSADFAVVITPVATSSKILLLVSLGSIAPVYAGQFVHTKIVGGNCATYIGGAALGYETAMTSIGATTDNYSQSSCNMMYLDSPATTSETTYTMHWASSGTSVWLNQSATLRAVNGNTASTFTAMEILA